ncbi:helix-turn-helix transcriptional regulator [Nonomuraea basaltis]|nr:helix-turn-helix transcriptional regulator [Nonomuraea basaltis]
MRFNCAIMDGEMSDQQAHGYELVADCRLRAAIDLFAHTWDPVVLAALRSGPRRRHQLRAAIGGMSDKVLTDALHRLLANGLIKRATYAEAPPRVDYSLTGLGESLVDGPMKALGRWILEHGDDLLDAQESAGAGPIPRPAQSNGSRPGQG